MPVYTTTSLASACSGVGSHEAAPRGGLSGSGVRRGARRPPAHGGIESSRTHILSTASVGSHGLGLGRGGGRGRGSDRERPHRIRATSPEGNNINNPWPEYISQHSFHQHSTSTHFDEDRVSSRSFDPTFDLCAPASLHRHTSHGPEVRQAGGAGNRVRVTPSPHREEAPEVGVSRRRGSRGSRGVTSERIPEEPLEYSCPAGEGTEGGTSQGGLAPGRAGWGSLY
jgi:hypothetical protein